MHTPNQTTNPGADTQGRGSRSMEDLQDRAHQATEQAKAQGKAKLDEYREKGADELQNAAEGMRAAASELDKRGDALLSQYVADFAGGMVRLADNLRGKSADEMLQQASRLARENPTLFIAGSVAVGFGLTRFARASGQRAAEEPRNASSELGRREAGSYGATADFSNASSHLAGHGEGSSTSGGHH